MPKITFEKELSDEKYALFRAMVRKNRKSTHDYIWRCIWIVVEGDLDITYLGTNPKREEMMRKWGKYPR